MTARTIHQALTMTPEQRAEHVQALRSVVREHDIYWWLNAFFSEWGVDVRTARPREQGGTSSPAYL